jgi:hypothetical protein
MQSRGLDAVVVRFSRHVYYFSAFFPHWLHQSALILTADGRSCLIAANDPADTTAVDENLAYKAQFMATLHPEQPAVAAEKVIEWLNSKSIRRLGLDTSLVSFQVARNLKSETELLDPEIRQMRRCKDPDELDLMKKATAITEKMYARAADIITPGIDEMKVFSELQRVAIETAQEPLTDLLGNDLACGCIGGPPRAGRTEQILATHCWPRLASRLAGQSGRCRGVRLHAREVNLKTPPRTRRKIVLYRGLRSGQYCQKCSMLFNFVQRHHPLHISRYVPSTSRAKPSASISPDPRILSRSEPRSPLGFAMSPANSAPIRTYSPGVRATSSGNPTLLRILTPPRLTAVLPASVITGTPIQSASHVVVPPPQGKGSKGDVDLMVDLHVLLERKFLDELQPIRIHAALL